MNICSRHGRIRQNTAPFFQGMQLLQLPVCVSVKGNVALGGKKLFLDGESSFLVKADIGFQWDQICIKGINLSLKRRQFWSVLAGEYLHPVGANSLLQEQIMKVNSLPYEQSLECEFSPLTLCLLVLSADNLCKQLGPRSGLIKCRA